MQYAKRMYKNNSQVVLPRDHSYMWAPLDTRHYYYFMAPPKGTLKGHLAEPVTSPLLGIFLYTPSNIRIFYLICLLKS